MDKKNTYNVKQLVVDAQTGAIIDKVYECDKVIVTKAMTIEYQKMLKQIEQRDSFQDLLMRECGHFFFYYYLHMEEYDMKESIKLRFLYLSTFVNYTNHGNFLIYDNGVKIDKKGLARILNLGTTETNKTLKELIEKKLIIEKDKHFVINDLLVKRGKLTKTQLHDEYMRVFTTTLRIMYKQCEPINHKQLYWFFKLLPYVSIKYNAICSNPKETQGALLEPLTIQDICKCVNYNSKNLKRFEQQLLRFRIGDQRVIIGIKNDNGIWYKINPRLYYGGTSTHVEELRNLISLDFDVN